MSLAIIRLNTQNKQAIVNAINDAINDSNKYAN